LFFDLSDFSDFSQQVHPGFQGSSDDPDVKSRDPASDIFLEECDFRKFQSKRMIFTGNAERQVICNLQKEDEKS
jgi:hypothetical protein